MPEITLPDESGDSMKLRDLDGFYLPTFRVPEEDLRSIPTWSVRHDDIMLIAYPRAGTHWLWEIISMIMSGSVEYKPTKISSMMEAMTKEAYEGKPSPRVLNTHFYPKYLPQEFLESKNKIIMILRNPKDVAVSFYNLHFLCVEYYKYDGSWKNYLNRHIEGKVDYGKFFDFYNIWQKFMEDNPDYPIHTVYYEDLTENCHEEVKKICKFLQIDRDETFLQTVIERCSFANMKKFKEEKDHIKEEWRDNIISMYRKGEVGDWKNWFTVAENEKYDAIIKKESTKSMFKFRYEL